MVVIAGAVWQFRKTVAGKALEFQGVFTAAGWICTGL